MRKVILFVQVSLDGFFEGPKKEIDWNMVDDELHAHVNEVLKVAGGFLSGRVTYELMAGYWPTADADPASTPFVKEFAPIWRDMPKVVYSKTLTSAGWSTTIARDVVRGEVEELKLRARGDLVVGGGDLGAGFMGQDLIDEYRIYVHPIQIGEGKRLFPPSKEKVLLRLAETRPFGNGVVLLRYERLRPRGGVSPREGRRSRSQSDSWGHAEVPTCACCANVARRNAGIPRLFSVLF
jgi:dihydrofolate reductase